MYFLNVSWQVWKKQKSRKEYCRPRTKLVISVFYILILWYFGILIFWSVNFHSGNMVRDWQTELSAKESDLRQSLQISQISIWIGSISEWCNFDRHTSHSGRRFSEEKNWWRWDLICDCCESLGRGFTPSGLLGLCWPQPIRGWAVEHWALHWALSWQPIGVLLFDDLDAFFGFFSPQPIRLRGRTVEAGQVGFYCSRPRFMISPIICG